LHKFDSVFQENSLYIGCSAYSKASAGPHQK
jgi:hypothetical protein